MFEWNQAQKSTLIVRHGDDHGTFIGKCLSLLHLHTGPNVAVSFATAVPGPARMAEIDFLATGMFPEAMNQTLVTFYAPGSEKGPIANPYTAPIGPLAGDSATTGI